MSAIQLEPSLDSVYEAVQRGHAVLTLVLEILTCKPMMMLSSIRCMLFNANLPT